MLPSANCLDIIKHFEGLRLKAYQDEGGVWTIGYGCTLNVKQGQIISLEQAEQKLLVTVQNVGRQVNQAVHVPLNQDQFDALVSFVYNIGIGQFMKSTMLTLLNNRLYASAAAQFRRWNQDNGKIVPGLINRRFSECRLFMGLA